MDQMKKVLAIRNQPQVSSSSIDGLRLGKIVGTDEDGCLLVDIEGYEQGSLPARLTSTAAEKLQGNSVGREVLLGFPAEGSPCPIIIDTLYSLQAETADSKDDRHIEAIVDRKRIEIGAEEEIVLRCGEASITLTNTGKVTIKGNYLLSRATGTNSIKGSSVRIN